MYVYVELHLRFVYVYIYILLLYTLKNRFHSTDVKDLFSEQTFEMSNTKTSGLALARSLGISMPKASPFVLFREGYHPILGEMDIFMAPFTIHNYSKGDVT